MKINQSEIIEDMEAHIRKFGGDFREWCVGTAKDAAFFQQPLAVTRGEELIYHEAYTCYAAGGADIGLCCLRLCKPRRPNGSASRATRLA